MKTLKDLTPDIRNKIRYYKDYCLKPLYNGDEHASFDREKSVKYIETYYKVAKKNKPVIVFAKNPVQYKIFFELLKKRNILNKILIIYCIKNRISIRSELDSELGRQLYSEIYSELNSELNGKKIRAHYNWMCSVYSRAYLTWYKFIQEEFNINHSNMGLLNYFYDNSINNIARCYFTKGYVLVLKTPKIIRRNDFGFHSIKSPAIEWDSYGLFYINGRNMPKWIFDKFNNNTLTKEDFLNEEDEDVKAGIYEIIESKGEGSMMEFLGGVEVDRKEIEHEIKDDSFYFKAIRILTGFNINKKHKEILTLYKSKETFEEEEDLNGNTNVQLAWLRMVCPSTGTNYLINTDSSFNCAIEAAKYHRPVFVPNELEYNWNSRN